MVIIPAPVKRNEGQGLQVNMIYMNKVMIKIFTARQHSLLCRALY